MTTRRRELIRNVLIAAAVGAAVAVCRASDGVYLMHLCDRPDVQASWFWWIYLGCF